MSARRHVRRLGILAAAVSGIALASCSMAAVSVKRYSAVYGIKTYANINPTNYGDADAVSMQSLLTQQGYASMAYGVDAAATKGAILGAIGSAAAAIGSDQDALFLFYFSGHGTRIESATGAEEYFAPYDAAYPLNAATLISTAELSAALAQFQCKNIVVILDTCYSGGFVSSGANLDTAPQNYGVYDSGTANSTVLSAIAHFGELLAANADKRNATPPIVISAAGSEESSYESSYFGSHGVFTYFMLQSAANGDGNGDGYVTATEACSYAASSIKSAWNANMYSVYFADTGTYADFMPRITGGARDLVLFAP